ncbi:hypothetical protein GCM10017744_001590 [Streptomyces antimycoticus]|uniref:Uncharacterized protein n=1 Tax=Streptomyces antimycoticus TaxID=68175 RepID=A0A4D4KJ23_9ACTN|nr:hypothetical protein SANT12839_098070 [Streptomyces antimycoticus]
MEDLPDGRGGDRVSEPGQFTLNPAMALSAVLAGETQYEVFDGGLRGRPSGTAALSRVVPAVGDEFAVPGQERAGRDGEDLGPAAAGDQLGQGGEPQAVRGFVPYSPL